MWHRKGWRVCWALLFATVPAFSNAAVLIESAVLVAKSEAHRLAAATPHGFNVPTPGRYRLDVRDVQFPVPLSGIDVVVTKGAQTVARLSRFGSNEFDATGGEHVIHALGTGTSPGLAGIIIAPVVGGAHLVDIQLGILPTPAALSDAVTSFDTKVVVTAAGTYQFSLTDRLFPTALLNYDAVLFTQAGAMAGRICAPTTAMCGAAPVTMTLSVGTYDLAVRAESALPQKSGLLSVKIAPTFGAAGDLYSFTHPVGTLREGFRIEFPANDQYDFLVSDMNFPIALAQAKAVIVQGSELLVSAPNLLSAPIAFTAKQGSATLYTSATPATTTIGVGTVGVKVSRGAEILLSDAEAIVAPAATTSRAYAFTNTIPAAGRYRFQARDFGFPSSIPTLQFIVVQDGLSQGVYSVGGSLSAPLKAGPVLVLAIANILNPSATGLFSFSIDSETTGARLTDVTQGVGDVFHKRALTAAKSGGIDVTLSDLGFPQAFDELLAIVTRGDAMTGYILGQGTFSFAATPGEYTLNFVARNKLLANYGLYGLVAKDSSPPTVTLTSNATALNSGNTATLTWTSTEATSCTASGGWTGSRPTAGSETTGPLTADTTWVLSCTGVGGTVSAERRVSVAPAAASASKGSGALEVWFVLITGLLVAARMRVTARQVK